MAGHPLLRVLCSNAFISVFLCLVPLPCHCERPQSRFGNSTLLAKSLGAEIRDRAELSLNSDLATSDHIGSMAPSSIVNADDGIALGEPQDHRKRVGRRVFEVARMTGDSKASGLLDITSQHGNYYQEVPPKPKTSPDPKKIVPLSPERDDVVGCNPTLMDLGPVGFAIVVFGCLALIFEVDLVAVGCLSSGFTVLAIMYIALLHNKEWFNSCGRWFIYAALTSVICGGLRAAKKTIYSREFDAGAAEFEEGTYEWWRFQTYLICEEPETSALAFAKAMVELLFVFWSCVTFSMKSIAALDPDVVPQWRYFYTINEDFMAVFFTIEYSARLWSARKRYEFVVDIMNILDLCTFAPWWVQLFATEGNRHVSTTFLRGLRIFKMFRLARFAGFSDTLQVILRAATKSSDALLLLLVFLLVGVYLIASLIWEVDAHTWNDRVGCYVYAYGLTPDGEPNNEALETCMPYQSVPDAFYYAVTTMTTVGYGDVVPVSQRGRIVACMGMVCGVLVIAMPVGILSTEFQAVYDEIKEDREVRESAEIGKECNEVVKELNDLKDTIGEQINNCKYLLVKSAGDRNSGKLASIFRTYCNSMNKEFCDKVREMIEVLLEMLQVDEKETSRITGARAAVGEGETSGGGVSGTSVNAAGIETPATPEQPSMAALPTAFQD